MRVETNKEDWLDISVLVLRSCLGWCWAAWHKYSVQWRVWPSVTHGHTPLRSTPCEHSFISECRSWVSHLFHAGRDTPSSSWWRQSSGTARPLCGRGAAALTQWYRLNWTLCSTPQGESPSHLKSRTQMEWLCVRQQETCRNTLTVPVQNVLGEIKDGTRTHTSVEFSVCESCATKRFTSIIFYQWVTATRALHHVIHIFTHLWIQSGCRSIQWEHDGVTDTTHWATSPDVQYTPIESLSVLIASSHPAIMFHFLQLCFKWGAICSNFFICC